MLIVTVLTNNCCSESTVKCDKLLIVTLLHFSNGVKISDYHCNSSFGKRQILILFGDVSITCNTEKACARHMHSYTQSRDKDYIRITDKGNPKLDDSKWTMINRLIY